MRITSVISAHGASAPRAALLSVWLLLAASGFAQPPEGGGPPPANVEITGVESMVIREEVSLTGSVVPKWGTFVASDVEGVVSRMIAENGEFVEKGAPLLEIRRERAAFAVAQAEADVALRQAALDELLNGTRREDIAVAEARVESARARVALTEATERRQAGLVEKSIVSQTEYDTARAELLEARAELALREAELNRDRTGARVEAIAAARAELAAAQARLGEARDILERHTIRAPFAGVLGRKSAQTGDWVELGESVFALAIIDPLNVRVAMPEQYISRVAVGAPARVTIDALDGKSYEGTVQQRTPIADDEARTYPVEVEISNKELKAAPGMFARVTIDLAPKGEAGPETPAILVPRDAVVMAPNGTRSVWVVEEKDGVASGVSRTIELGRTYRGLVEVKGDVLKPGDRVVVRGNENLMPGATLNIVARPGEQATAAATSNTPEAQGGNGSD